MKRSIRRNILVFSFLAQGVLIGACAISLVVYIDMQRLTVLDTNIARQTGTLVAAIQISDADQSQLVFTAPKTLPAGDLYVIRNSMGSTLASSAYSEALSSRIPATGKFWFASRGLRYRGELTRSVPILDPDDEASDKPAPLVDIWYAVPSEAFALTSRRIIVIAIFGSVFWIASSCLIAWFSVARGMLPMAELAKQASSITERSWTLALSTQVREVSETRPLALALESLVFRLRAAFERERTFVNDAAHELKTVVAIQKSSLQVALQGNAVASDYRIGLERALEDVDRLNALVHRMLSLASIEGSDQAKEIEWVALDETILAACDQLGPVAAAHRISIKTRIAGRYYVPSEEGLLQALWVTLLENAIRYSPAHSSITVDCHLHDNRATVVVQDCGAGIRPEDLPHIFERFYRGDASRSRDTGGFGLGLAIAKAIVEKHNGDIAVESERDAGTIVRVGLPAHSGRGH